MIAGVLKRQMDEAKTIGADQVVATDDDTAIANLPPLDAVADTVGGRTAEKLIAKVKPGGVFASVLGAPQNAAKYPSVKVVSVFSKFDRKTLEFMAEAVRDGKLVIPISQKLPLSEAAEAQAAAEKGGIGKILLVPDFANTSKEIEMKKDRAESIPLRNRVATGVWNAWRRRKVGGFISVGVRSAGTSDAATVLRASMHQACGGDRASDHCQLRAG